MIQPFSLSLPATVAFGPGVHSQIGTTLQGWVRPLVVTGPSWFSASPWASEFARLLPATVTFHRIPSGEPTIDSVAVALAAARAAGADCIVGIGGGSVLDTAKAVAGLYHAAKPPLDYLEGVGTGLAVPDRTLPWVAVPTTAGTGSEATRNAVLRVPSLARKKSLRSARMMAAAVVIDPELTVDLPAAVTGTGGLDAVCQLVEAYVTRKAAPVSSSLVAGALGPTLRGLRQVARQPHDLAARTQVAYGAFISGVALANSGLGAAHGLASGIGGLFNIPHGLICALALGPVCRANAAAVTQPLRQLLCQADLYHGADPVNWLEGCTAELVAAFDLPVGLRIPRESVRDIVSASQGGSMAGNPLELPTDIQEDLVEQLISR